MKTVACVVVKSPKVFTWLSHMPVMNWALAQLTEVRGVDRIVCAAAPELFAQTKKLLAKEDIEVVALPPAAAKTDALTEAWLTAAGSPADDADVVVVVKPTSPFLPAAKIEQCLAAVRRKKHAACSPARPTTAVLAGRRTTVQEPIDSVRAFRVAAPPGGTHTVSVSLIESLDVDCPDEFVVAAALADAGSV